MGQINFNGRTIGCGAVFLEQKLTVEMMMIREV